MGNQYGLDFNVTEISHIAKRIPNPNWSVSLANGDYHILAFAISGKASYLINGRREVIGSGDVLFFPKGTLHSGQSDPVNPWTFYTVSFDIEFYDPAGLNVLQSLGNVIRGMNSFLLSSRLEELNQVWTAKRTGYTIRCRSILMELLYLLIRKSDQMKHNAAHYQAIEKVIKLINDNFEKFYSIDDLAKISGLSSSYFRTLFKKVTGESAIHYQNKIKVAKAKDFLLSGDCNVSEAARLVGFSDIYYFSRLFKKLTGENPSSFIRA